MSGDENLDSNLQQAFCVTATNAKRIYFLETSDIKWIPHKSVGGRFYGGNFKLFTAASLEDAAIKKHGKDVYEAKKLARQDRLEQKRQREEEKTSQEKKARLHRERAAAIPKRPLTAWALFQKEERDAIKKENPDVKRNAAELAKIVSSRYKALSVDEKKVLDEKVARSKLDYQRQVKSFQAKYGPLKR